MARYKAVLFDLDGTINDSGPGIMKSVQYALEKMGADPLPGKTLRRFVGPSLQYGFMKYAGMDEEEAQRAIALYRENYHAGAMYDLTVYDGIGNLLEALGEHGVQCAVVTTKPQVTAEKVLDWYDMRRYFACVIGPGPEDTSNQKSILIGRALAALGMQSSDVVMIGDTRFDMIGASEAGCDSIGVTYGYGTREELKENGAVWLADSASDIAKITGICLD